MHKRFFLSLNFPSMFLIIFSSILLLMLVTGVFSQTDTTVTGQTPPTGTDQNATPPIIEQPVGQLLTPTEQPPPKTSWFGFLAKGGLTMIPIALCSVGLIAIVALKFPLFRLMRFKVSNFADALAEDVVSGHIDRAIARCEKTNNAITRPIKKGLDTYKSKPTRIQDSLREAMLDEIPGLESYIGWLGVIAGVSPLLGLYGTVVGVIQAFIELAAGGVVTDPNSFKLLADAIYKALITTAAGLFVGIPAFVAYEYLRMKIADMIRDMDRISISLLNALGVDIGDQS